MFGACVESAVTTELRDRLKRVNQGIKSKSYSQEQPENDMELGCRRDPSGTLHGLGQRFIQVQ